MCVWCDPTFWSWESGGGAVSPPAGSGADERRQTHFGNNLLKINLKSGLFSVSIYTPNSDTISDVHWLVRQAVLSVAVKKGGFPESPNNFHCASHSLNLALSKASSVTEANFMLARYQIHWALLQWITKEN